jgi:Spy/CpxP family protein refolding chaperone
MSNLPPALPQTYPARPRRWVRIFAALLIFFGGMVCGGGLAVIVAVRNIRHAIHHPEEVPGRITRYLTRRLDLTADQADQVERDIAECQMHLQAIRRENQPRVSAELLLLRQRVAQVLTPEQRSKWDDIFDDAIDRWMPPPPPPPSTQPF